MENLPGAEAKNWLQSHEHTPHSVSSFSPSSSSSFSPITPSSPPPCITKGLQCCKRKSCWCDSLLPTVNLLHRKHRRESGWPVWLAIFFHLRRWASRWGCRAPLAIETNPSPAPFSGLQDSVCVSFIGLASQTQFNSFPLSFFWLNWCLVLISPCF